MENKTITVAAKVIERKLFGEKYAYMYQLQGEEAKTFWSFYRDQNITTKMDGGKDCSNPNFCWPSEFKNMNIKAGDNIMVTIAPLPTTRKGEAVTYISTKNIVKVDAAIDPAASI